MQIDALLNNKETNFCLMRFANFVKIYIYKYYLKLVLIEEKNYVFSCKFIRYILKNFSLKTII